MKKLPFEFYQREDVVAISRELLGKVLITNFYDPALQKNITTAGIIVETEAYKAPEDKASHAYNNKRTKRTETMFSVGGVSYVYLCYGIHHLFNVVTGCKDLPHGVLIRAIKPLYGIEHMLKRRNFSKIDPKLSAGPGTMSMALGITTAHNCTDLTGEQIWIEEQGINFSKNQIITTPRIGINYAQEYITKPWRFVLSEL